MSVAVAVAVPLDLILQGESQRARKSFLGAPLFAATDSAPTLSTSFQRISSRFQVGSNPSALAELAWTKASGTSLTVAVKTSSDDDGHGGSNGIPYEFEPSYGAPSSGISVADIYVVTYASSTWVYSGSPSATIAYLKFRVQLPAVRFFELWAKSDNASGSITGSVFAGTQG